MPQLGNAVSIKVLPCRTEKRKGEVCFSDCASSCMKLLSSLVQRRAGELCVQSMTSPLSSSSSSSCAVSNRETFCMQSMSSSLLLLSVQLRVGKYLHAVVVVV